MSDYAFTYLLCCYWVGFYLLCCYRVGFYTTPRAPLESRGLRAHAAQTNADMMRQGTTGIALIARAGCTHKCPNDALCISLSLSLSRALSPSRSLSLSLSPCTFPLPIPRPLPFRAPPYLPVPSPPFAAVWLRSCRQDGSRSVKNCPRQRQHLGRFNSREMALDPQKASGDGDERKRGATSHP